MHPFTDLAVLIATNRPGDVDRLAEQLRHHGFYIFIIRAETEKALLSALDPRLDILLVDVMLPGLSISRITQTLQERRLSLPLITITDANREELGIESLRQGADDYLCRDRLSRLGIAANRAIEQHRNDREADRPDQVSYSKLLFENLPVPVLVYRLADSQVLEVNPAAEQEFGFSRDELLNLMFSRLQVDPGSQPGESPAAPRAAGDPAPACFCRKDGSILLGKVSSIITELGGERINLCIVQPVSEPAGYPVGIRAGAVKLPVEPDF